MNANIKGKILKFYVEQHYTKLRSKQMVCAELYAKFKSQPKEDIDTVLDGYDLLNEIDPNEIARQLLHTYREELRSLSEMQVEGEHGMISVAKVKARLLTDMGKIFVQPDSLKKMEENLEVVLDLLKGS